MARTKKNKAKVATARATQTARGTSTWQADGAADNDYNDSFQRPSRSSDTFGATPTQTTLFSLQEEALHTEKHRSEWTPSTKLRYQSMAFVSAGSTSVKDETMKQDEGNGTASSIYSDLREDTSSNGTGFFCVDTQGQQPHIRPRSPPVVPLISPNVSNSDSEDEVLFQGRKNAPRQVVDDPISANPDLTLANTFVEIAVTKRATTRSSADSKISTTRYWNDSEIPWVHHSKPGYGWTTPRSKSKQRSESSSNRFLLPDEPADSNAIRQDYVEDAHARADNSGADSDLDLTMLIGRALDVQLQGNFSDSSSSEDDDGVRVQKSYMPRVIENEESIDDDSEVEDEGGEEEEDDDDDDSILDDLDLIERKMARSTDEKIARLLAKQEELGIPSDELLLHDYDDDTLEAAVIREARTYKKKKPKKARHASRAHLIGYKLDEPAYDDFDVMDFDRHSLKARRKGKRSEMPTLENLSDPDLIDQLTRSWETDRARKKARKEEREALRAQGLLGRGKKENKADLTEKYNEGMSIYEIKLELELFLNSSRERLSFPPMDKRYRKMIHELSAGFNVRTKSTGSGKSRYTTLTKSPRTLPFNEAAFMAKARKVNLGFFPRLDKAARKATRGARDSDGRSGGGSGSSGVKYRDGDVVGGAAPVIGVENKGRMMLEKMGWSVGTALGNDRQGILEPIAHVVKNSKAGLG